VHPGPQCSWRLRRRHGHGHRQQQQKTAARFCAAVMGERARERAVTLEQTAISRCRADHG
jgi:hypothetical protein